jgi:hypothetical protein
MVFLTYLPSLTPVLKAKYIIKGVFLKYFDVVRFYIKNVMVVLLKMNKKCLDFA